MKAEFIWRNIEDVEEKINEFLESKNDIKIKFITQSESTSKSYVNYDGDIHYNTMITIVIWYE